jgi:hypothetical protein
MTNERFWLVTDYGRVPLAFPDEDGARLFAKVRDEQMLGCYVRDPQNPSTQIDKPATQ